MPTPPRSTCLPAPRARLVTRRTLLGSAGAAVVLAGCASPSSTVREPEPRDAQNHGLDPDVAVATEALAAVHRLHDGVLATSRRFPELRKALAPLARLHEDHARALTDAVPREAVPEHEQVPYVVPGRSQRARRRLRSAEQRLHDQLGALARRAESGDFARLLAAMGAGLAQQLEGWSR